MHAHQIFQHAAPEWIDDLFGELRDQEREVYKTALTSLANQKKLRPVFVQRKPVPDQIRWMHQTLKQKTSDELAEHLLQLWLLGLHKEMLVDFLDQVGVEHDGEGAVHDLPESLDAAKLKTAVDALFEKYPEGHVILYLQVFQLQRPGGWEELGTLLGEDERFAAFRAEG